MKIAVMEASFTLTEQIFNNLTTDLASETSPPTVPTKLKDLRETRQEKELVARLKETISKADNLLETARQIREKYGLGSVSQTTQVPFSFGSYDAEVEEQHDIKPKSVSKLKQSKPLLDKLRPLPNLSSEKNTKHKKEFMKRFSNNKYQRDSTKSDFYSNEASLFIFIKIFLHHISQLTKLSENGIRDKLVDNSHNCRYLACFTLSIVPPHTALEVSVFPNFN